MKITCLAFKDGDMIPKKYTCQGEDICPSLDISDPPASTKSLAIMIIDPDAPSNHDFAHWLIWNIDPVVREIMEETTLIGAVEGTNDFGKIGYGGPCPPSGTHHYEFHLYALDVMLDLPATSKKKNLRDAIEGHVLEEALLTGLYAKTS